MWLGSQAGQLAVGHSQIPCHGEHPDQCLANSTCLAIDLRQYLQRCAGHTNHADHLRRLDAMRGAFKDLRLEVPSGALASRVQAFSQLVVKREELVLPTA